MAGAFVTLWLRPLSHHPVLSGGTLSAGRHAVHLSRLNYWALHTKIKLGGCASLLQSITCMVDILYLKTLCSKLHAKATWISRIIYCGWITILYLYYILYLKVNIQQRSASNFNQNLFKSPIFRGSTSSFLRSEMALGIAVLICIF